MIIRREDLSNRDESTLREWERNYLDPDHGLKEVIEDNQFEDGDSLTFYGTLDQGIHTYPDGDFDYDGYEDEELEFDDDEIYEYVDDQEIFDAIDRILRTPSYIVQIPADGQDYAVKGDLKLVLTYYDGWGFDIAKSNIGNFEVEPIL